MYFILFNVFQISTFWWLANTLLHWLQCPDLWISLLSRKPVSLKDAACRPHFWWPGNWRSQDKNHFAWGIKVSFHYSKESADLFVSVFVFVCLLVCFAAETLLSNLPIQFSKERSVATILTWMLWEGRSSLLVPVIWWKSIFRTLRFVMGW